jgi:Cu2+-exporting ATPase
VYDEEGNVFCCEGCKGVYRLIKGEGLERFYFERKWDEETFITGKSLFKKVEASQFEEYVREAEEHGLLMIDLYIENIRCAACIWLIEKVLQRTKGVKYIRINFATHKAQIKWDPKEITLQDILDKLVSIGYRPKPYIVSEMFLKQKAEAKDLLIRFGTAAFLSSQLMMYSIALYAGYFEGFDREIKLILEIIAFFLTVPVIFYAEMPFIKNSLLGLKSLHFTMDTLISVGAFSAFVFSIYQIIIEGKVYFDTAAMIVTIILLGRYIETTQKVRVLETLQRRSESLPKEARLFKGDTEEMVPIESVKVGDLIKVLPGERVPIDGIVVDGQTETDESLISGESKPVYKQVGSQIIGGSINLSGVVFINVTKMWKDTMLAGILNAVNDAQMRTPKIHTVANRVVGIFVPVILMVASATVFFYLFMGSSFEKAIMTGISVVVIACPCSLGLATPLAVLIATTTTTTKGLLIKGGDIIEQVRFIDTLVFDKTGTLTKGSPQLENIINCDRETKTEEVLLMVASIEAYSEHPIAKAVVNSVKGKKLYEVDSVEVIPGMGIEGRINGTKISIGNRLLMQKEEYQFIGDNHLAEEFEQKGKTVIFVGWNGFVRAYLVVSDSLREEVREVIQILRQKGLQIYLLSGDNSRTTSQVASALGIENVIAEATPQLKQEFIRKLKSEGKRVLMVGDGINDAPSLSEATVGVAMVKGTQITMESADVILVREDLHLISFLLSASKKTSRIIKQNIVMSFFYNITAVPIAMAGLLHPIIAASAMAASSLCVVSNSLRLKKL